MKETRLPSQQCKNVVTLTLFYSQRVDPYEHVITMKVMTIITTHPAALSSHCFPNPCKNEGLCAEVKNREGYMCVCKEGFVGTNCESKDCHKALKQ